MKPKVLATVIMLVFVAAAVIYLVVEEAGTAGNRTHSQTSGSASLEATDRYAARDAGTATEPVGTPESEKPAPAPSGVLADGAAPRPARDGEPNTPPAVAPGTDAPARPAGTRPPEATSNPGVIAYYFHATQRCATCRKLEAYSNEAIVQGFPAQLRDGRLEWRVVNVDEPENKHFVDDYKLYTRSLVIVRMERGRQSDWKNLERIWDLVDDKAGFLEYVQKEINAYMGTS